MAWQDDVTALSALYLMVERGQKFMQLPSTDVDRVAAPVFDALWLTKRVALDEISGEWEVTDKGRDALKRAIAAQDVLRQMEIFTEVDVTRELTVDEASPTDPNQVRSEAWDPRFAAGNPAAYDMRLAVISWLAEKTPAKKLDLRTIVFLQKLGSGAFSVQNFWANQPALFAEIDAIVVSAYQWQHMAPEDPKVAGERMQALYTAGQLEQRKREGSNCGGCGIPLVMFEQEAAAKGQELSHCPSCSREFPPPAVGSNAPPGAQGVYNCPKCEATIYDGDRVCGGCGALVDFSLPVGSVQTDTTEEVTNETVWSADYDYVSYGWFDPWDPYLDIVAFDSLFYDPWMY